jgi:signal transduction histidine kinase
VDGGVGVRPRILGVLLALLLVVLGALGVPLAVAFATSQAQRLFVDRLADADRLASIALQADADDDTRLLRAELQRYEEVYGVEAALLDPDGRVSVESGARLLLAGDDARRRVRAALGGRPAELPRPIWPWSREPVVVAVPLVRNGDVVGAVATVSPVDRARAEVMARWGLVAVGEVLALAGGVLLAARMTRWVLRPVHVLDATAHEIATGRLAARVPEGGGPPELRRLTASFNDMARHVQQVVDQQRAFVADASHQLRNPLGALLLRLDDLALRLPGPCGCEIAVAADEGRHLARVLDRLLELARAEHVRPAPQVADVVPVVDERISAWQVVAVRRELDLRRTGADACWALVDLEALSGALDVLLDNACKFAPDGTGIVVAVTRTDAGVVVAVDDEGPGLDDDELARAGDRFWRAGRHQNVDGSGLGLAIARTLLEAGGGRLDVARGARRGLSVRLTLPASPARLPRLVHGLAAR